MSRSARKPTASSLLKSVCRTQRSGLVPRTRHPSPVRSTANSPAPSTLAGLAWWSGMTFLVGATLSGGLLGEVMRDAGTPTSAGPALQVLRAASALLALAAAAVAARRWPGLRSLPSAGVALVLVALAGFMPALGAVLLALAVCATGKRWLLAASAAVTAAWIVGGFYYQLAWPLAAKALLLVGAGAVLGALAWLALGPRGRALAPTPLGVPLDPPGASTANMARLGIAATALAVFAVANLGIWQKEDLIAHGQPVFVEMAPSDPRSLMQGDFMTLNFRMPADVQSSLDGLLSERRPKVVGRRDARGVATLLRLDDGKPLAADEMRIELTPQAGSWVLVSNGWSFKEGEAARWSAAKYGEFRVDPNGRALLVGLRGTDLEKL